MTIKEKVYMGLAALTFFSFMGPVVTTVVMREARIERSEESIKDLEAFKEEVIRKYIKHLEEK